jgi:hypothetical protein
VPPPVAAPPGYGAERCRAVGAGSLGARSLGARLFRNDSSRVESVWRAEVSNRTGCGSGHCGLRVGCACLGHHPLRPVPAVRGIAGDRSLRWRAIRHRAAGHRTLCSRRESVSDRAARLSAVRWRT